MTAGAGARGRLKAQGETMATYHLGVIPMPGTTPDPSFCPLAPCDVIAGSAVEAMDEARARIAEQVGSYCEELDGAAAERAWEQSKQWQPTIRQVDRPTVDVTPRSEAIDVVRDGQVIGQHYDYGADRGEQSFHVLIDDAVCGRLDQRVHVGGAKPGFAWCLTEAVGPISFLAGRQWEDPAGRFSDTWPSVAIAGIRAALEGG